MKTLGNLSTIGLISVLTVVMFLFLFLTTFIGSVSVSFDTVVRVLLNKIFGYGDISDIRVQTVAIIWQLYAPRGFMGLIVGATLALVGVVMQAMVQNPLADPYILGISSGASLGATFAILMAALISSTIFSGYGVQFFSFLGAISASVLVFALASRGGRITSTKLVLSGCIISALYGAVSNVIVYLEPNAQGMRSLTFWLMGSLSVTGFDNVLLVGIPLVLCLIFFLTQMRNLNAMLVGDDTATTLGVNLSTLRIIYIIVTSLLVALAVSVCGIIGFVGLIIPHIARALVGINHWRLLPVSILLGAIFMMVADVFARTFTTSEIPIGIITALCGAPVFAYIMIKKSYGFGSR